MADTSQLRRPARFPVLQVPAPRREVTTTSERGYLMGLPKIPDAKEIADMTALAMEPMMAKLELIHTALSRLVEIEEARVAYDDAMRGAAHGPMHVVR